MYPTVKRLFDFFFALVAFVILLPLVIPIIIALKLTNEGHVFYKQKRIGYKREYFYLWKFCTMLKNSPNIGTGYITVKNDPRTTYFGVFLRRNKINELPHIINVLIGNLSIVGPRPLVDFTFNSYSEEVKQVIYNSKPGITGIGSLVFIDEETLIEKSQLEPAVFYAQKIAPYKGKLELWYQKHKGFKTDLIILMLTFYALIFKNNLLVYRIFKDLPKRPAFFNQ